MLNIPSKTGEVMDSTPTCMWNSALSEVRRIATPSMALSKGGRTIALPTLAKDVRTLEEELLPELSVVMFLSVVNAGPLNDGRRAIGAEMTGTRSGAN